MYKSYKDINSANSDLPNNESASNGKKYSYFCPWCDICLSDEIIESSKKVESNRNIIVCPNCNNEVILLTEQDLNDDILEEIESSQSSGYRWFALPL